MKKLKFSLIEILVVVAIIGILASFLMPTLKKARDSARRASCMNNMKQMAIALVNYHSDNEDYYPAPNADFNNTKISWDDLLGLYDGRDLTQAQMERQNLNEADNTPSPMYLCPSNRQSRPGVNLRSYSMNAAYVNDSSAGVIAPNNLGSSISLTQISNPSDTIVNSEAQSYSNILGFYGAQGYSHARYYIENYNPDGFPLHNNDIGGVSGFYVHDDKSYKMNFSFADGHAEYRSVPSTLGSTGASNFYTGAYTNWGYLIDTPWNALK
ncbi:hypothetical protein LNTAR_12286 [Lentisphaera araneosa HTCC2155]|uniref:DUF1559 domain-containing protein n=1 Tax=Lentisphaera araneosa HTCC2155 TaxID=313628 RepID=A6DJQ8_9BACT|nr:DUF1559 domain-containing protein [Lentisphaera araneosa]EDM28132.1 hypothetical protein LNTAR_12286 [Lentisphaera araneosa HTCC2155]